MVVDCGIHHLCAGLLSHLHLSRTALVDKYEAKLAAKDQEIGALNQLIINREENFKSQLAQSEHSRLFFEKLASLPEDDAVEALKIEYELRLTELDRKESEAITETDKEVVKGEISQLKKLSDSVNSMLDSGKAVAQVVRLINGIL